MKIGLSTVFHLPSPTKIPQYLQNMEM